MSCVYAVASGKGGVGKTAVTSGLAALLSSEGRRVVIIDADIGLRSQDAMLSLENRVVYDLMDVIHGDCELEQALLSCDAYPSLQLLPAAQFARSKSLEPKQFRKIIQTLRKNADDILIDCPAGIERGLRNVLNAGVDEVLLIVTPDDISVRSGERVVQVLEEKGLSRPFLIVNRLDEKLIRSHEMMSAETVAETLDLILLGEIPEDPVVYRAILRHELFIRFDCGARAALMRIASRIQGRSVPFPQIGCGKQSLFRRLFAPQLKEVIPLDDH